jgi:hypothetical protein
MRFRQGSCELYLSSAPGNRFGIGTANTDFPFRVESICIPKGTVHQKTRFAKRAMLQRRPVPPSVPSDEAKFYRSCLLHLRIHSGLLDAGYHRVFLYFLQRSYHFRRQSARRARSLEAVPNCLATELFDAVGTELAVLLACSAPTSP